MKTAMWLAEGAIGAGAIARGIWLYRASLTWPTPDGTVTRLDVESRRSGRGDFFLATLSCDFRLPGGELFHGTWSRSFSSVQEANEFAERELHLGQRVVVRSHRKNAAENNLQLDSWTYTGDRRSI